MGVLAAPFGAFITVLLLVFSAPRLCRNLNVNDFAQLPDTNLLTLSPDGTQTAALVRLETKEQKGIALQLTDLKTQKKTYPLLTDNSKYIINLIQWKDSNTLLVHTYYPSKRDTWVGFAQVRGDTRETRLLIVDTSTAKVTSLFKRTFLRNFKVLPLGKIVSSIYYPTTQITY